MPPPLLMYIHDIYRHIFTGVQGQHPVPILAPQEWVAPHEVAQAGDVVPAGEEDEDGALCVYVCIDIYLFMHCVCGVLSRVCGVLSRVCGVVWCVAVFC